eukprot:2140796-Amphidinium_carterae.1
MLLGVSFDGALRAHSALIVGPENKATALRISHRQRSDTCRKPGTAFTMEYKIPGTDVRALVVQQQGGAWILRPFSAGFSLSPLRSERILQSTQCEPLSFHDTPIQILLFSHVCVESVLLISRTTSARKPPIGVQVACARLQHEIANDPQQQCTQAIA